MYDGLLEPFDTHAFLKRVFWTTSEQETAAPVNGLTLRCDLVECPGFGLASRRGKAEDVHMQHTSNRHLVLGASLKVLIGLAPLHPDSN